jgi:hypothetical protein
MNTSFGMSLDFKFAGFEPFSLLVDVYDCRASLFLLAEHIDAWLGVFFRIEIEFQQFLTFFSLNVCNGCAQSW